MKFLGYSIDLNIIILIGILYLIMVVNAISGSCKREGLNISQARTAIDKIARKLRNNPNMSMDEKNELRDQLDKIARVAERDRDGRLRTDIEMVNKMLK